MVVSVELQVTGWRDLSNFDPTTSYARMASYLTQEMHEMFETEGASRGHPWKPLSPRYAAWKEREGRSPKILQLTGVMRASFIQERSAILELNRDRLVFGSQDPKAAWHHDERPLLVIQDKDLTRFERILEIDLQDHFDATGGGPE